MLGHLRSKALDDFKTKLDESLNNGEGFASSVRMWTQSIMLEFDKRSAGNNQIGFFFMTYTLSPVNLHISELLTIWVPMLTMILWVYSII